jgi:hypothetical protein
MPQLLARDLSSTTAPLRIRGHAVEHRRQPFQIPVALPLAAFELALAT